MIERLNIEPDTEKPKSRQTRPPPTPSTGAAGSPDEVSVVGCDGTMTWINSRRRREDVLAGRGERNEDLEGCLRCWGEGISDVVCGMLFRSVATEPAVDTTMQCSDYGDDEPSCNSGVHRTMLKFALGGCPDVRHKTL